MNGSEWHVKSDVKPYVALEVKSDASPEFKSDSQSQVGCQRGSQMGDYIALDFESLILLHVPTFIIAGETQNT